jgi:glutamyl-tRNA synthetase
MNIDKLAEDIFARLQANIHEASGAPDLKSVLNLYRERANNLNQLANDIAYFYAKPQIDLEEKEKHLTAEIMPILTEFAQDIKEIAWSAENIHSVMNALVAKHQLKFPKLAMPLRIMLTGIAQSPSIDQVMVLLGQKETLERMELHLS